MRRSALAFVAAAGVCLAFGLSATSAQKAATGVRPAATRADVPVGSAACTGGPAVHFLGVTSRAFPVGVGALSAGHACNAEFPGSRLCEWKDIFRQIPPPDLSTEVLVAPNFETDPVPACLNPAGGLRCGPPPLMRPAACCGPCAPPLPAATLATIILTPSNGQPLTSCSDTFDFTAVALDTQGNPMAGVRIVFETVSPGPNAVDGVFNPSNAVTDTSGQVKTTVSVNQVMCNSLCMGDSDCSTSVRAKDSAGTVFSNLVPLVDNIQ